ncbi:MAG: heavy metal translocating P-type ATPase, partial [Gemmatimonadota bacterium]|nr:heavy metal translocating P-type ATPase [Gemmatimonadota bacterium]
MASSVAELAVGAGAAPAVAADSRVKCIHCGLAIPTAELSGPQPARFCCAGCETAFAIVHDRGLDAYYRFGERREHRVHASGRAFEEFDHEAFTALYVRIRPDGLSEVELYLEGVHCASCVWLVERVALTIPDVTSAELDIGRSRARIIWNRAQTPLSAIARVVDSLGYIPHPFRGGAADAQRRSEDRAALVRIGIAGAVAGNVMMIALAIYAGWFGGIEASFERYFRWWSFALTTPSILWPGSVFFRSAWGALRRRTLHMDVPIALALAGGYLHGAVNTIRDAGPVYFDGVATLIFLLLVGRLLQQRAQRMAVDAAELLQSLAPSAARVVETTPAGETIREVPAQAVLPGWLVDVRAGDTLPADGTVEHGTSSLNVALLTGESKPVPVSAGAAVFAGTLNLASPIRVRVTQAGETSRLGALLRDVEESARRRSPVVHLADRMAAGFIVIVLALAGITFGYWMLTDASRAMDNTIAMLVVTCPCALALATPLAVTGAIGRAAARGILVRGGDALETLAGRGTIVLDKTGTVTEGTIELVGWTGDSGAQPLVAALERQSRHPIATALTRAWDDGQLHSVSGIVERIGGGIAGIVDGRHVAVGSTSFVREHLLTDAQLPPAKSGCSAVYVAVDAALAGVASFGDPLRADAPRAAHSLRQAGWRIELLSGDDPAAVASAARELGIAPGDARGGATPEAKRARIAALAAAGPVVMVGDGVNDAPAIAAATVGIGVHGGAETCLATADVFLARPGLVPLVELIEGSRRTMRLVRVGIAASILYNIA